VSKDEITHILQADPENTVTEADIADIIQACDRDGDGELNWQEVVAAMKH
jgi:Ca2+-binding EF-hand superfamily protein